MTTTDWRAQLNDAMDRLGNFPLSDDIAAMLKGYGITGKPGCPSRCPLAVWLLTQVTLPPGFTLEVGDFEVIVREPRKTSSRFLGEVVWQRHHTPTISVFVRAMDRHTYPELEAQP